MARKPKKIPDSVDAVWNVTKKGLPCDCPRCTVLYMSLFYAGADAILRGLSDCGENGSGGAEYLIEQYDAVGRAFDTCKAIAEADLKEIVGEMDGVTKH